MPTKLYGGLHEAQFRLLAKEAVADWWNDDSTLVAEYGSIELDDVFVVWQVKAIQNSKAVLGVSREGDGLYFEYTWNGDAQEGYLDVYKKQDHITDKKGE